MQLTFPCVKFLLSSAPALAPVAALLAGARCEARRGGRRGGRARADNLYTDTVIYVDTYVEAL